LRAVSAGVAFADALQSIFGKLAASPWVATKMPQL
jgi:hypothetical protein